MHDSRRKLANKLVEQIQKVIDDAIVRLGRGPGTAQDLAETEDPFLASLLSDRRFHRAVRLERSLRSSLGSAGYEELARIVAEHTGAQVERGATLSLQILTEQRREIDRILDEPYNRKNPPDWKSEVGRLSCADRQNPDTTLTVTVDLKVIRNGRVELFFMKTVKPNRDQTRESKRYMLLVWAHQLCTAEWEHLETFFALPYNPFGEGQEYRWSLPWRYFRMDGPPVLIGKAFWDTIGGEGTYELLLEAFREAGNSRRVHLEEALNV